MLLCPRFSTLHECNHTRPPFLVRQRYCDCRLWPEKVHVNQPEPGTARSRVTNKQQKAANTAPRILQNSWQRKLGTSAAADLFNHRDFDFLHVVSFHFLAAQLCGLFWPKGHFKGHWRRANKVTCTGLVGGSLHSTEFARFCPVGPKGPSRPCNSKAPVSRHGQIMFATICPASPFMTL